MLTAWIFNEKNLWADLWIKNHYKKKLRFSLTLSWWRSLSYRNQSTDLQSKSMDWFLYDRDICHERVITEERDIFTTLLSTYGETFSWKWLKKAKIAKSQFQYFFWTFLDFRDRSRLNVQCVAFNRGHSFETLRSLMSWDGKKPQKKFIPTQHHWR